jgi:hypothetical protein
MTETSLTPQQVATAEVNALHHSYLVRVLKGVDELANVVADGNLDETISARVGRLAPTNELAKLVLAPLDLIQANHGEKAEVGNLADAQKVEGVEEKAIEETGEVLPPPEP